MTLNEDVTKAKELYSSANESEFAVPTTQYTLKDAVFLMLRATATKMDLIPEISDDIRQAYELYKEFNGCMLSSSKSHSRKNRINLSVFIF